MTKGQRILLTFTLLVVGIYYLFSGLVDARAVFAPLLVAIVLALIVLPLSQKMEKKGISRGWSTFANVIFLFIISLGFLALISFQVKNFVDDWPEIKEAMKPKVEQLKAYTFEHTQLKEEDLNRSNYSLFGPDSNAGQKAFSFFSSTVGFVTSYLLTFIYIFFILNYRRHFRKFLLRIFPEEEKMNVNQTINKSATVTQQYLVGKLILMGLLAVVYSVGLGISGVNNFILVSLIAALLTLIPYVGNVVGFTLATLFGFLTSGDIGVLIGVIVTFSVAQFVESYILQPYVVGDKVDLHPFFVILGVVVGGALWGVVGMILAIPVLAILTNIFLQAPVLHPFGFLLSKDDPEKDNSK